MVVAVLAVCVVAVLWGPVVQGEPEALVLPQEDIGILNNPLQQEQLFQEIGGIGVDSIRNARRAASPPSYKGKPTACLHRGKNVEGVCLQLRECYPFYRFPESQAWVYGIYDSCLDQREGATEYGVCCIQVELEANNEVEPTRYDADDKLILDDSMVPGLMDRGHVEYRPPRPFQSLNLTRKPTQKWENTHYPLFPAHPTHPPLPTHPPSITNQPWWNPTTKHPIAVVTHSSTYRPPTTSAWWTQPTTTARPIPTTSQWWQPQTTPTTPAVAQTPASTSFSSPCSAASVYHNVPDAKAVEIWSDFYNMTERVVGGFPSKQHSHPWLAVLFNGPKQFCGGSLIDKTHILTAAHCIAHMTSHDVSRLRIRLGAHNIHASESSVQEFKVTKVVRHKDYDARKLYNDVALLTLDRPAQFNQYVRPICLASGGSWVDKIATVAGWGSLYEGGPQPGRLQEVRLRIWSLPKCKQYYGNAAPGGIVSSYICAGDGGKDSCMGDSGGPLVLKINNVYTQIGIVSWGIGCGKGEYPGVYSRLPTFLGWINRVKAIYR